MFVCGALEPGRGTRARGKNPGCVEHSIASDHFGDDDHDAVQKVSLEGCGCQSRAAGVNRAIRAAGVHRGPHI
eukprot:8473951-Pyramimonas_sp.AAC.1